MNFYLHIQLWIPFFTARPSGEPRDLGANEDNERVTLLICVNDDNGDGENGHGYAQDGDDDDDTRITKRKLIATT